MNAIRCDCGAATPSSARYGHAHLNWCVVQHGMTCQKIRHTERGGYLHGADDDRPYNVDGVMYCGRCHVYLT